MNPESNEAISGFRPRCLADIALLQEDSDLICTSNEQGATTDIGPADREVPLLMVTARRLPRARSIQLRSPHQRLPTLIGRYRAQLRSEREGIPAPTFLIALPKAHDPP
jgi:hypothetical protein